MIAPTAEELGKLPDNTSMADLQMMADAMRSLTGEGAQYFAFATIDKDLMVVTFEEDGLTEVVELAKEQGALALGLNAMFMHNPEIALEMVESAAKHMLEGVDATDGTSAGGWNSEEVALAYAALYVARDGLSIPFGSNLQ